jgi:hypothetical protein
MPCPFPTHVVTSPALFKNDASIPLVSLTIHYPELS